MEISTSVQKSFGLIEPGEFDISCSGSATVGIPRSKGGKFAALTDILIDEMAEDLELPTPGELVKDYLKRQSSPDKVSPVKVYPGQFSREAVRLMRTGLQEPFKRRLDELGRDYPVEPLVIREYGFKVRIVTRTPYVISTCSETLRKAVLRRLLRVRAISHPLETDVPFLRIPMDIPDRYRRRVFSIDLSKATDTLCHWALQAALNGLGIGGYSNLLFGGAISGRPVTRGTLMGIPLSWPILSAIHYVICRYVDKRELFLLKGDDLIAFWTTGQYRLYCQLIGAVGFRLNERKTFISPNRGIFCETAYVLGCPLNEQGCQEFLVPKKGKNFNSLRFVVSLFDNDGLSQFGVPKGIFAIGDALRGMDIPRSQKLLFQSLLVGRQIQIARGRGIDVYAPKWAGGYGLLPKDEQDHCSLVTAAIFRRFSNEPDSFPTNYLQSLFIQDEGLSTLHAKNMRDTYARLQYVHTRHPDSVQDVCGLDPKLILSLAADVSTAALNPDPFWFWIHSQALDAMREGKKRNSLLPYKRLDRIRRLTKVSSKGYFKKRGIPYSIVYKLPDEIYPTWQSVGLLLTINLGTNSKLPGGDSPPKKTAGLVPLERNDMMAVVQVNKPCKRSVARDMWNALEKTFPDIRIPRPDAMSISTIAEVMKSPWLGVEEVPLPSFEDEGSPSS